MIDRRGLKAFAPFGRLERLLSPIKPNLDDPLPRQFGGAPIALSIGEPRRQPPSLLTEGLAEGAADWSRYPPPRGTASYLEACADWLVRRYGLPESAMVPDGPLDPQRALLPLPGSREGLFFAALAAVDGERSGPPPLVLIPNPFYHAYAGAAAAAGCEAVFVPASAETGFLPDYAALPPEILERTALCFLCTPSNPQGMAAGLDWLKDLIALARRYDIVLAIDECYAEIYTGEPPCGALQAAMALDEQNGTGGAGGLDNLLLFHSLSKRSSAPGLRCAFVAGDPRLIESLDFLLRTGGAGVALPVLAAGTRLWKEETHVAETRDFYRENFGIAERVLGDRFARRTPDGGFFLWLDVGDGEEAAVALWREAAIRVLPGAYMAAGDGTWGLEGPNPGKGYIRVALVHGAEMTEAALSRLAEIL